MKQTLLLFLGATLLTALPAPVQAQFTYTTNNGAITITKYTGSGGAVAIPRVTNRLPVTSIGDGAFQFSSLASVTFPNTLINIGAWAFYGCSSLSNIEIPNSITSIGEMASLTAQA